MRFSEVVCEEPTLDGCERDLALGRKLGEAGDAGRGRVREGGDGGRVEKLLRCEGDARLARLGGDENGEDAVAAQLEEVVVDADALNFQNPAPDIGERALGGGARSEVSQPSFPLGVRGIFSTRTKAEGSM
jgi:hypothetical protein